MIAPYPTPTRDYWRDETSAHLERLEAKIDYLLNYTLDKELKMSAQFDALAATAARLPGLAAAAIAALATHNNNAVEPASLDAITAQIAAVAQALSNAVAAPTTAAVAQAVTDAIAATPNAPIVAIAPTTPPPIVSQVI